MARDTFQDVDASDTEGGPDHLANAVVIFTTLILVGAIYVTHKALKDHFNAGMLADKKAAGAP